MAHSPHRRALLLAAAAAPLALAVEAPRAAQAGASHSSGHRLADLEKTSGGRLGVYALDTADGTAIRYRQDERFAFCSTFKFVLAAAVLAQSVKTPDLMERRIMYGTNDIADYSPSTTQHIADGMTVAALCQAAVEVSDNTAANLLIKELGGPSAVTAFARSIGDREFRLDRCEPALNTAIPGDPRNTTTPAAMGRTTQSLALGDALPPSQRQTLQTWLRGCQTGAQRIRASVPADCDIGDKTGTGSYGTTNDIAVLWPHSRKPIILAVYYTQQHADAKPRDDVVAAAARIALDGLRLESRMT